MKKYLDKFFETGPEIYRIRPRFKATSVLSSEELCAHLKSNLEKEGAPCKGNINTNFVTLYLPAEEQHFWSPQISMTIEDTDEGSEISGLFGPRAEVWTMFVFLYAVIGFLILVISVIGLSNVSMNESGLILWLVPILVIIFLSLYLGAYFGQKLGYNQMVTLHEFLISSLPITPTN